MEWKGAGVEPDLEAKCRVYNVNPGRNPELLGRSRVLAGYARFVGQVRSYRRDGLELGEAVDRAMDDCIREDVLGKFFQERRSEVRKAMQLDFTWERREKLIRKEEYNDGRADGKAEGRADGKAEGRAEGKAEIVGLMLKGGLSHEELARILNMSVDEVKEMERLLPVSI